MRIAREKQAAKEAAEKKIADERAQKLAAEALAKQPASIGALAPIPEATVSNQPSKVAVAPREAPTKDIVDNVMGTLRKADAGSILDEVRRRRQANTQLSISSGEEIAGAGPRTNSVLLLLLLPFLPRQFFC